MRADYPRVTHPFATVTRTSSYCYLDAQDIVRLACLIHAASVRSEPGSNSPLKNVKLFLLLRKKHLIDPFDLALTRDHLTDTGLYKSHHFRFEVVIVSLFDCQRTVQKKHERPLCPFPAFCGSCRQRSSFTELWQTTNHQICNHAT